MSPKLLSKIYVLLTKIDCIASLVTSKGETDFSIKPDQKFWMQRGQDLSGQIKDQQPVGEHLCLWVMACWWCPLGNVTVDPNLLYWRVGIRRWGRPPREIALLWGSWSSRGAWSGSLQLTESWGVAWLHSVLGQQGLLTLNGGWGYVFPSPVTPLTING